MTPRIASIGCALAATVGTVPVVAAAQTTPTSFIVTSIGESDAGKFVMREALSLERAAGGMRLELANDDGSTLTKPVTLTAHGEIALAGQDGAVTCYNMAQDVLASQAHPAAADPAFVFVRFGNSVVRVPLALSTTTTHGGVRRMMLEGTSAGVYTDGQVAAKAGVIIRAAIDAAGNDLRGASFDEVHYLGDPAHVIAHSTCILSRSQPTATART
jgi:hypothetical protein